MGVNCSERACLNAFIAGDARIFIELNYAVGTPQRVDRTNLFAGRNFALAAYDRHSNYRMGIGNENPYSCLLWIVHAKMLD